LKTFYLLKNPVNVPLKKRISIKTAAAFLISTVSVPNPEEKINVAASVPVLEEIAGFFSSI
jgi:hypothetical protein